MGDMIKTNIKVEAKDRELHIKTKLPQIILPKDKINIFIDWWNQDIRFLSEVPRSFEEGYFIIHTDGLPSANTQSELLKRVAKAYNITYRQAENTYKEFTEIYELLTLHFHFIDDMLIVNMYGANKKILTAMNMKLGSIEEEPEIKPIVDMVCDLGRDATLEDYQNCFSRIATSLLVTSLWYLATTKSSKYYYERSNNKQENSDINEDKRVVNVKKFRAITTPIYDFSKVKQIRVEDCVKHRKGWTYSHSFQVHGHYRHYKNGKVIFVKSFIKGKEKRFKSQIISLEPNNKHNNI